jgi:hypothetical protein
VTSAAVRQISWTDVAPFHARLEASGIPAASFPSYIDRVHQSNLHRVREGDLDHLVFYALQSTRFTALPPLEPALSAKALVEALTPPEREAFFQSSHAPLSRVPPPVRARFAALLRALDSPGGDERLAYFRSLAQEAFHNRAERDAGVLREYTRAMRFLYQKEFVAQRSADPAEAVEDLYRSRGLSTDTAVEAGYLVYLGVGVLKALEPDRRVHRVLIVGPGMDLAPRTGLIEEGPPESYQPWAVVDALVALGLSRLDDLEVVGADINPRVVSHLQRSRATPPVLTLVSGVRESSALRFSDDYREYFAQLGRAIDAPAGDGRAESGRPTQSGQLRKMVRVRPDVARVVRAELLDITTERLNEPPFDLIVATNILPYFDDVQLMLATSNIAAMLAPGGVLLHNEARPALQEIAAALQMPAVQSRRAVIATVRGAPAPLFDSIWVHEKRR